MKFFAVQIILAYDKCLELDEMLPLHQIKIVHL